MYDTFVYDILTGANTPEASLERQEQLISLCARGHFQLRKWASNSSVILQSIPECDRSMSTDVLFDDVLEAGFKILGMRWNPNRTISLIPSSVLAQRLPNARFYRISLASSTHLVSLHRPPSYAKHLMQLLWTSGIGWDLQGIQNLSVLRRITMNGEVKYELHAFSDSSEKGYVAAVYLRCDYREGIQYHLITSRTKVTPLKRVTIPRLKLCGAVLAAQLLQYVHEVLKSVLPIEAMHAWTDSTTTLAWIKSSSHR
ncbi:uncharacterized protein LOC132952618 [Metopolophium dirhodum]|uniref:uncharacterized protein LOC132952618 n=1 Tax=Metopolophium dirhodum TaxID=44670 RepID=UPI00298F83C1|nr:uncharacterized protein LOC132952618 [Metopolophium dirhodum]